MASAGPPTGSPLRRSERVAILAAIGGVTALAWLYLVVMAAGMEQMPAPEASDLLALRRWTARDFALMLLMWIVMMVGMMLPSATPMTLLYAQVARKARREGAILAPAGFFATGYLLAWSAFSLFATLAQWGLDRAALLSPMMVSRSPQLGAALLIGAGVYQLTPLKNACLRHCRDPARFFARSWRPGTLGALRLGWVHGVFCLGCCWVLMGLLFVGGVMNLLWIAAITLFVLIEKVMPFGVAGGRAAGIALIGLGVGVLFGLR